MWIEVKKQVVRYLFKVRGVVQGVGFRPFVSNLALIHHLCGNVLNGGEGVVIDVEGDEKSIVRFAQALVENPPELARIEKITNDRMPIYGYKEFVIKHSEGKTSGKVLIPPDIAICSSCCKEINDAQDRHYHYPFTNCTKCGPRFTVVHNLPYDRKWTAMAPFSMCSDCNREYHDPSDRRFHAQPIACLKCGPQVELVDNAGALIAREEAVLVAGALLKKGHILAIKGLGGFHLACDAANSTAVKELRKRKNRPAKPFAVMCRDMETIKSHCYVTQAEMDLIRSPAAPIVLLQKCPNCALALEVAQGLNTLGVVMPYTPLHMLLLNQGPPTVVMTSGNLSHLPLVSDNRRALVELGSIADYFLRHNRDIANQCDDSVTTVIGGKKQFLRRSRGYVPEPIAVPVDMNAPVMLGIGGEMKNTFCLIHEGRAYMSQHMGEMNVIEGQQQLERSLKSFCQLIGIKPQVITGDLHPQYQSCRLADELTVKMKAKRHPGVQHHHAHLASCMAENGIDEEVIGVILDGTGYGLDGKLWGFEILHGDYQRFCREYYLDYVPLPGGEFAVRYPWLTAVAYLRTFLGERGKGVARCFFGDRQQELAVVEKMLLTGFNMPYASSCGRFFDAVAALLGVCVENTYEGQAAVLLSSLLPWFPSEASEFDFSTQLYPYSFAFQGHRVDPAQTWHEIIEDIDRGISSSIIAKRFHDTIIRIVVESVRRIERKTGLTKVALSGGSWNNRYLLGITRQILENQGFTVLCHQLVPPGDGGIALGQAMVAIKQDYFTANK